MSKGLTLTELNAKLVKKKYKTRPYPCHNCGLRSNEVMHQSGDDSCLYFCYHCKKPFLVVAPEFLPFGEWHDQATFIFHCAECGKDDIWGIVPEGMKSKCECCT